MYFIRYMVRYTFFLVAFRKLCAGNLRLCSSGATLWFCGTTALIDLYHLLFFSNRQEVQDVLNVTLLLNVVFLQFTVMENSNNFLVYFPLAM